MIWDDIEIKAPFEVEELLNVQMRAKANHHANLLFKCLVKPKNFSFDTGYADCLVTFLNAGKVFFTGHMIHIKTHMENSALMVSALCFSSSFRMDVEGHSRSYQDVRMTYGEVAQSAAEYSKEGNVYIFADDKQIPSPIYQWGETDWEFALRMASNLSTVLVPDYKSSSPQVGIGFPSKETFEVADFEFDRKALNPKTYAYERTLHASESVLRIKSNEIYELGDRLIFQNAPYIVGELSLSLSRSLSEGIYHIGPEEAFARKRFTNQNLQGAAFVGRVIDVKGTQLKLHLDIDEQQKKESAFWYDYLPFSCNAFYAMPAVGEVVVLVMNNRNDNSGAVPYGILHGKEIENYAESVDVLRFQNTTGDRLSFTKEALTLDVSDGAEVMEMNSEDLCWKGASKISFSAAGSISLNAHGEAQIKAPAQIFLQSPLKSTGIEMSGNTIQLDARHMIQQSTEGQGASEGAQDVPDIAFNESAINTISGSVRY